MSPQFWQALGAIAATLAGLYAIVTRPIQGQLAGMQAQLTDIQARLRRIEDKLENHSERIARLEERRFR